MHDRAEEFAATLARECGLAEAIALATDGIISAQESSDFYSLSIWREVRRILREWDERSDDP